jgi:FkbM family methyltransferase
MRNYWRIASEQERPAKFVVSRLLMWTGLSRLFLIRRPGFVLRFYPTYVSARLWLDERYHGDFDEEHFLRAYLRPGDMVVDAGANIGFTTMIAASSVGPAGGVIAIEPHPRTFSYLRGNVLLNRANVQLHNLALGEQCGRLNLTDEKDECVNAVTEDGQGLAVALTRLDDIAGDVRRVRLLKLDVEGYELFALRGGTRLLENVDCVYVESFEENFKRYGYGSGDLLALLRAAGFQVFRQRDAQSLVPVGPGHTSRECENLIAVRDVEDLLSRTRFHRSGDDGQEDAS